jgi:hypothetical protein
MLPKVRIRHNSGESIFFPLHFSDSNASYKKLDSKIISATNLMAMLKRELIYGTQENTEIGPVHSILILWDYCSNYFSKGDVKLNNWATIEAECNQLCFATDQRKYINSLENFQLKNLIHQL